MNLDPASASSPPNPKRPELFRLLTGLEATAVYAGVLLDIWRWQRAHPRLWIALLAAVILSHIVHRDRLRDIGLGPEELRGSAESALPLMLLAFVPLLVWGFASGRLQLLAPSRSAALDFARYASWCAFQQYVTQGYFHNRLLGVIRTRHLSSAVVALMFAGAHLPNPVLTAATAVAGFIFSEVFARHRNIWPLALAQTVGGFLVAAVAPPGLIHNMRVGPGYYLWGLQ